MGTAPGRSSKPWLAGPRRSSPPSRGLAPTVGELKSAERLPLGGRTIGSERVGIGRTAEIRSWGEGQVLKLFYDGFSAAWAEEEARATGSLYEQGLPVPRVGEVLQVEGRPGIVFQRIEGPSMLAHVRKFPFPVTRLARLLAELHATVHARHLPELPALRDALESRIEKAPGLSGEEREGALAALRRLPDDSVVCHGDFHPDNVLMSPRGPIIIDWTDVHRGHPTADVAKTSLLLRLGEPPPGTRGRWLIELLRGRFQRAYLRRYRQRHPIREAELEAWGLPVAAARLADGIPQERKQLVAIVRASLAGEA